MDFTTYEPRISALEAGGGGGGDSDFSTAEVTISNTRYESGVRFVCPLLDVDELNTEKTVFYKTTQTVNVILFNGMSGETHTEIDGAEGPVNVEPTSVGGGVEHHGYGFYSITGDGTITF